MEHDHVATDYEAHREFCHNAGADHPEQAWISSPWDAWERNPFYRGPKEPHPEDDEAWEYIGEHGLEAWRELTAKPRVTVDDDEIAF